MVCLLACAIVAVLATLWSVTPFAVRAAGGASATQTQGVLIFVNSTGDGGNMVGAPNCDADVVTLGEQCTLRAAIQAANLSPGDDGIEFAIPPNDPNCAGGSCTI